MKNSTYIKLGIVISFSLFALIWGVNFLKGKGTFDHEQIYYVVYDRIDGLEVSNAVLINGFRIGQVREIHFMPDGSGRLVVTLALKENYALPKKTVARIFSSDLMGTKSVELILGKSKNIEQPGDTLIPDFEGSLQEMVSVQMLPLKTEAENLMKEMKEAIDIVKFIFNEQTRENIMESFQNMKTTFAHLENSSSNLDSVVQAGKTRMDNILTNVESISNNLKNNNLVINNIFKNLSQVSDSLARSDIKSVIAKTNKSMTDLQIILDKINSGDGSISLLLNDDTLYSNLNDVSYNLNRLLEDMRMNPKRYVHFSAFDLGKTVYVDGAEPNAKKEKKVYKIQIMSSNHPIALKPENFKGYKNVEEASFGGSYIYLIGNKKDINSAKELLREVQDDFPDAVIVEIKGGSYSLLP